MCCDITFLYLPRPLLAPKTRLSLRPTSTEYSITDCEADQPERFSSAIRQHMPLLLHHPASTEPPSYAAIPPTKLSDGKVDSSSGGIVYDGTGLRWQIPLLICRALSMAPALWWGLRCAFTFLGELLLGEVGAPPAQPLDAEKRFRITEVFLAILWVGV